MIVDSLLDTDLYKFTMMQVVYHQHRDVDASYKFICRTKGVDFSEIAGQLEFEIQALCQLTLRHEELDYLKELGYFKADFLNYLATFSLESSHIKLTRNPFSLTISGPWIQTILFETPLLAIISELYAKKFDHLSTEQEGIRRLAQKVAFLQKEDTQKAFQLIEFGTRRRYSKVWQKIVLESLHQHIPERLLGTSNVFFAKSLGLLPSGTMAHEFLQAYQAFAPLLGQSQQMALRSWLEEYPHVLGVALSDVIGLEAFLNDFDLTLSRAYKGVRHDSGDPYKWGDALVAHYQTLSIDPTTKQLIFSNSLTFESALAIMHYFKGRITTSYGIGTYLTHDLGNAPPDIVIKMVSCNHQPVAKISDNPAKSVSSDPLYLQSLKEAYGLVPNKPEN